MDSHRTPTAKESYKPLAVFAPTTLQNHTDLYKTLSPLCKALPPLCQTLSPCAKPRPPLCQALPPLLQSPPPPVCQTLSRSLTFAQPSHSLFKILSPVGGPLALAAAPTSASPANHSVTKPQAYPCYPSPKPSHPLCQKAPHPLCKKPRTPSPPPQSPFTCGWSAGACSCSNLCRVTQSLRETLSTLLN